MKIYDIDNLRREDQEFDLITRTFIYNSPDSNPDIQFRSYKIQKGEEMRIDLICNSIYGNLENIDILLNVNNISNPLNLKEGSTIIYPEAGSELFRYKERVDKETTRILSDPNRAVKKDKDREKYQNQNFSTPPTILQTPLEQVTVDGGLLQVGNNLFSRQ
jgi:hypothetical protein